MTFQLLLSQRKPNPHNAFTVAYHYAGWLYCGWSWNIRIVILQQHPGYQISPPMMMMTLTFAIFRQKESAHRWNLSWKLTKTHTHTHYGNFRTWLSQKQRKPLLQGFFVNWQKLKNKTQWNNGHLWDLERVVRRQQPLALNGDTLSVRSVHQQLASIHNGVLQHCRHVHASVSKLNLEWRAQRNTSKYLYYGLFGKSCSNCASISTMVEGRAAQLWSW